MSRLHWYLVHGQLQTPYLTICLPGEIRIFTSLPVKAPSGKAAINVLYSKMLLEWNRDTDIDGMKCEDLSDDHIAQMPEERIKEITLAQLPIDPNKWTAETISETAASDILDRHKQKQRSPQCQAK